MTRLKTLLGDVATATKPDAHATALNLVDSIAGTHAYDVGNGRHRLLRLLAQHDLLLTFLCGSPNWIPVSIRAREVVAGVEAEA